MGELIPLFPLGSPLFPGVVLPLHIFEPRYRRLVQDLIARPADSDQRFFGVVAIRQGWEVEKVAPAEALYDVGCTAQLRGVRPQPDGGFGVVTVGGERFRLLNVVVGDDPPYLQGEVEWLADEEAAEAGTASMAVLVDGVSGLFGEYVAQVAALGADGDEADVAELLQAAKNPVALSWLVASAALL